MNSVKFNSTPKKLKYAKNGSKQQKISEKKCRENVTYFNGGLNELL